ncbi:hypothetical protein [Labrys neptuniae]|uniref:Lectin-like protein BA14k n=1 Tax=Labrys neptuniae TaxID=376174 RepID=A0ABV3PU22_9HYPH
MTLVQERWHAVFPGVESHGNNGAAVTSSPHQSKRSPRKTRDGNETMFKKILTGALVAATLAGTAIATTGTAEARYGRGGAFAAGAGIGLLGGLLAGSAYNNGYYGGGYYDEYRPVYYRQYRRCYIQKRWVEDYYGGHWARVRVCY